MRKKRKTQTKSSHKQDRNEDRMRRRHRRGAGRKSKGKKKGGKGIGFVMTVSSPVAAEMRVHMLQWSDSEKGLLHSRLPGKELVIPPPHPTPSRPVPSSACSSSFHILFLLQRVAVCGTRKPAAPPGSPPVGAAGEEGHDNRADRPATARRARLPNLKK